MESILKFVCKRKAEFAWPKESHEFEVEIRIPDLRNLPYKVWGDWGAMYKVELEENNPIEIDYCRKSDDSHETYKLQQNQVELKSPMSITERNQYPIYYVIKDHVKEVTFNLYINQQGEVGKIESYKTENDGSVSYNKAN